MAIGGSFRDKQRPLVLGRAASWYHPASCARAHLIAAVTGCPIRLAGDVPYPSRRGALPAGDAPSLSVLGRYSSRSLPALAHYRLLRECGRRRAIPRSGERPFTEPRESAAQC